MERSRETMEAQSKFMDSIIERQEKERMAKPMNQVLALIADERKRQIEVEGFTPEHDDEVNSCETLSLAAACYALGPAAGRYENHESALFMLWPWNLKWWKRTPGDRIRELVKAGALIVAEIERLQRIK